MEEGTYLREANGVSLLLTSRHGRGGAPRGARKQARMYQVPSLFSPRVPRISEAQARGIAVRWQSPPLQHAARSRALFQRARRLRRRSPRPRHIASAIQRPRSPGRLAAWRERLVGWIGKFLAGPSRLRRRSGGLLARSSCSAHSQWPRSCAARLVEPSRGRVAAWALPREWLSGEKPVGR